MLAAGHVIAELSLAVASLSLAPGLADAQQPGARRIGFVSFTPPPPTGTDYP